MMRRPRKLLRLFPLLLALSGGAIVNVAVAWGCVAFSNLNALVSFASRLRIDRDKPDISWITFDRVEGFGTIRHEILSVLSHDPQPPAAPGPNASEQQLFRYRAFSEACKVELPRWCRLGISHRNSTLVVTEIECAAGWPTWALWGSLWESHKTNGAWVDVADTKSAIMLEPRTASSPGVRALPLIVIWPGFAINTVFYAAILWPLFAAPGTIRRAVRRRRNQCPACGYPVGESAVCTECGNALTIPARSGSS